MKKLDPTKLFVEMRDVNYIEPMIGRKYTLTHSDTTGELFLTVGNEYACDKVSDMRDEVLAEWRIGQEKPYLFVYIPVDNQLEPATSQIRNTIFRRELPLALEAIRFGDGEFFDLYPEFAQSQIWIHFDSSNPDLDQFEYWGTPEDYK